MAKKLPDVNPLALIPLRYEDRRKPLSPRHFKEGEGVFTAGTAISVEQVPTKTDKEMTVIRMVHAEGPHFLVRYLGTFGNYLKRIYSHGNVFLYGSPKKEDDGLWCFWHPDILSRAETGKVVPVYKKPQGIGEVRYREHIQLQAHNLADALSDEVSAETLRKRGLPSLAEAISQIHYPTTLPDEKPLLRLAYREVYEIKMRILAMPRKTAPAIKADITPFLNSLPFKLTGDQTKAVDEVLDDMATGKAMRRLLIGDVGSGKTAVAMAAAYASYRCGLRSMIMAPTTVLAGQLYDKFAERFGKDVVSFCTGEEKTPPGMMLVGTHALLYRNFTGVALKIVDEQQKWGVRQRNQDIDGVHVLQMSATPIPRTVALLFHGAVDFSVLREAPFKRDVATYVVAPSEKPRILGHIRNTVAAGGKVLVIYPLVEADKGAYKAVEGVREIWEKLHPGIVLYVHGKLEEKLDVIREFRKSKNKNILVATSLIEIGIDIPEASVLVVAGAEKFGLSQLHQLRGRVGRTGARACCYFIYKNPDRQKKLKPLEQISDGLRLAEIDACDRGLGNVFGAAQTGNFYRLPDMELYKKVVPWVDEDIGTGM